MKSFKHWTPRYILDRLKLLAYERTHPDAPWLNQAMVRILASWLRPEDRVLEWGSGRSTLWFACRVGQIISIEHDESWYRRVSSQIEDKRLRNVDYRLSPESEYATQTADFSAGSFDVCLIDGIVRDDCALAGLRCLKPGGILVVDNCNWYLPCDSRSPGSRRAADGPASQGWGHFLSIVEGWRRIWTSNGVYDTALWVKSPEDRPQNTVSLRSSERRLQSESLR